MSNINEFVHLTDEQIEALELCAATKSDIQAIESAATAPLLERITELEQQLALAQSSLEDARKDAGHMALAGKYGNA